MESCIHCAAPVRLDEKFCCTGCEAAYAFISAVGLNEFYNRKQGQRLSPVEGTLPAEFRDIDFATTFVCELQNGLRSVNFILEGITCSACAWLLERLPLVEERIKKVNLSLGTSSAEIIYDSSLNLQELALVFARLGYVPHLFFETKKEERKWLLQAGIAFASMISTMHVSLSLYAGILHGMNLDIARFTSLTCMVLSLPAFFYSAMPFYVNSYRALRAKTLNLDFLVSVTIVFGFLLSLQNIFRGINETYFEALSMLVALLLIGRLIVHYSYKKLQSDGSLFRFLIFNQEQKLIVGAEISIKSGETFPCDGRVVHGQSMMNSAWLTGEDEVQGLKVGSQVWAGAINQGDLVRVVVEKLGRQTRAGQILTQLTLTDKGVLSLLSEKLEKSFVFMTLILVGAYLLAHWGQPLAVQHAVSLLIVMCPCALGLAVPAVISTALNQANGAGLLIKGEKCFERISEIDTVIFDKTGTLTDSQMSLVNEFWDHDGLAGAGASRAFVQRLVESAAQRSSHPQLRALAKAMEKSMEKPIERSADILDYPIQEIVGQGVICQTSLGEIKIGNPGFVGWKKDQFNLLISLGGQLMAAFFLESELRPHAGEVVNKLQEQKEIFVLSGDHSQRVKRLGQGLTLAEDHLMASQSPEMKLQFVEAKVHHHKVMMIGDGINDALAFKKSHVAVGMTGGAGVAMDVCDVYLLRPDLNLITQLFSAAKKIKRAIYGNMFWVLLYNSIGSYLVLNGVVGPIACAVLMPLSSVTVLLVATQQKYFEKRL